MLSISFLTISLLLATALSAPAPPTKLRKAAGRVIPDSYIVVLKKDASRSASLQSLNDLVLSLDDASSFKEVGYDNWDVLNAFSAKLGGAALQHMLDDPNVDYVEPNGVASINWEPQEREAAAAFERSIVVDDIPHALSKRGPGTGAGTDFYSIDTGVRVTHTSFGGRASWGAVFGGYAQTDGNGHGTHTAGTAAGVGYGPATDAEIFGVKVLSDTGSGSWTDVISGIDYVSRTAATRGRPTVANLSLGGEPLQAIDDAVNNGAKNQNVLFSIAAGNENVDASNTSPARAAAGITVGALTSANGKASFSNYGAVVDCWYLGVNVKSAWSTSDTASNTISGTSMAAPGVGGLALVYRGNNPTASAADVQAAAKAAAIPNGATGIPSGTTKARCVPF